MDVFYDEHYVGAAHAFDTTRKARHVADALVAGRVDRARLCAPDAGLLARADAHIGVIHTPAYVRAIRIGDDHALATSQGFEWDPGIWQMARHSTAGVIGAVEAACRDGVGGSLSSGLHHAGPGEGKGFCTVNGLAVAASAHLAQHPDDRIVILDVDAHCGGGTARCLSTAGLADRVRQLDLATDGFDRYAPPSPEHVLVQVDGGDDEYLGLLDELLDAIDWAVTDLVLLNAGVGPYPELSSAALAEREHRIFAAAAVTGTPVAFVLAGGDTRGITMDQLVDLHLLTLAAAARHQRPFGPGPAHR